MKSFLTILGLNSCANTIVGNEMLRGVSGGQKRRVTSGEFCVTPSRTKFFDAITNGLDSATSFDIIRAMKIATEDLGNTSVVSLLQVMWKCALSMQ